MIDEIFDYEYKVSDVLMPCIYFLFDNGNVVYVGKTEYGLKRILCHISDKKFDNVKIKVFNKELLDEKETYYIAKYNPKYNKVIPHAYSSKNIKHVLLTKYGVRTRKRDIELWICDNVEECYFFKGERCINESAFQKCLTYFAGNKI